MPATNLIEEIAQNHLEEWLNSAVDESIIRLNVETVNDEKTISRLLGWKSSRWKSGWSNGGGWIVHGDSLGRDIAYAGLQFKPDNPRTNADGKPVKYESPLKGKEEAVEPLFLRIPDAFWEKIAAHWRVPILPNDYQLGFWKWLEKHPEIPIAFTEGGKKEGAIITSLIPAISIPGVSVGQWKGRLNPLLKPFITVGRTCLVTFDSDLHIKPNVRRELDRFSRLIAQAGAVPELVIWEHNEETKGADDLIAAKGHDFFRELCTKSATFEEYRKQEILRLEREDPDEPAIAEHFNQIAQRELFSDRRWVCIKDTLHYWTGTHYEPSPDAIEKRRISDFCSKFLIYDQRINKRTYKYANEQSVSAVFKWVKVIFAIDPLTVNPSGLNLANGVLCIEWHGNKPSWTLKKHDPQLIYTYCSKVSYNPKADPEPCDRLLIALDDAQREVFLKTIAACLDLANVRKVMPDRLRGLLLQGDGSNGKDTLRESIAEIFSLGITGCSLRDFQQYDEGKKFPLSKLEYSRINWASENHSRLSLDSLQSLKNVLTGDPIDIERKNQDDYSIKPACIVLLNCNEAPSIVGTQKAIESRYAIVKFSKTFTSDPQSPDELPADPRFKNDPEFLQNHVCPSLLNRLLDALVRLMADGIDYKPLAGAIQEAKESSCHLIKWAADIKLEQGKGQIKIGDLFESLKSWYVEQGILDIELTTSGKEKLEWLDEGNRFDPWIKAPRLMRQGLTKIFPKARFSEKTEHGFFVLGIQSINFAISPNFGSFGSGEEEKEDTVRVLEAEPNPEPNNFASGNEFASGANRLNQISNPEPNFLEAEPKKPDNHAIPEPTEPTEPNLQLINSHSHKQQIKIGDHVIISNLKSALIERPRMSLELQTAVYEVRRLNGDRPQCFYKGRTFSFKPEWLTVLNMSEVSNG